MSKKRRDKDSSLIQERDKDLLEAYENVIKKHGKYASVMPKNQLIREAIETSPKQFYITEYTATVIINNMLRNKK